MLSQLLYEPPDLPISPHPSRKPHESCFLAGLIDVVYRIRAGCVPADESVYCFGIGSAGFDGDNGESVVCDRVFGYLGARGVEFGTVGGVAG